MTWRRITLISLGGLLLTAVSIPTSRDPTGIYESWAVVTGWTAIGAGIVAARVRPANRFGPLLILLGYSSLIASFHNSRYALLFTIGVLVAELSSTIFVYLVLSYPEGTLKTTPARAIFGVTLSIFLIDTASIAFYVPQALGCVDCPENLALIRPDPALMFRLRDILMVAFVISAVAVVVFLIRRFAVATTPARRVLWPVYVPVVVLAVIRIVQVYFLLRRTLNPYSDLLGIVNIVANAFLPFTFLFGLTRQRAFRSRVGELVVELGRVASPVRLRDALARTLGDPSVEVGFWSPAARRYFTAEGAALDLPGAGEPRAATFLESKGEPLAAIVHDPALLEDPKLVDSTRAAAGLAVEKERLEAEVRAQLDHVRASRARLVEASDNERRRLERDLHDGVQQRLIGLAMDLRMLRMGAERKNDPELLERLDQTAQRLDEAIAELRELAQGIHPVVLREEGLRSALQNVVERTAVPVELEIAGGRYPAPVEVAAYFVAAEALTNIAKYARASSAAVKIGMSNGGLRVEVADDGVGGADPSKGSGLLGLEDRVAAVGGRLHLHSPPGGGTTVVAELPCE